MKLRIDSNTLLIAVATLMLFALNASPSPAPPIIGNVPEPSSNTALLIGAIFLGLMVAVRYFRRVRSNKIQ